MKISSESPLFQEKVKNEIYNINYGTIVKGGETRVEIIFEDVSFLSHRKSCTCTTPTITILPRGVKVVITYDSKKIGTINQYAEIKTVNRESKVITTRINLKGQVV